MIRLYGEDTGGRAEIGFAGDEWGGSMVSSDADVLEDKGSEKEVGIAGVGAKGGNSAGGGGIAESSERSAEVDLRLGDGRGAERATKELDVLAFLDGGFDGVGPRPQPRRTEPG